MNRSTCVGRAAACLTLALAAACGGDNGSLRDELARLPQEEAPAAAADSAAAPPPLSLADTVGFPGASLPVPPDTLPAAPADTPPPSIPVPTRPMDARPWIPERPDTLVLTPGSEWTARAVERRHAGGGAATQTQVRAARNDEFDRLVLQFEDGSLPGYRVEYVDRPVRRCGSGEPVSVEGDGWLRVRLSPARAHDARGRVTVGDQQLRPDLPVLREARLVCDHEGQVEWVLGVRAPNRFRVLELQDPARLVVDVRH